jgi:hypothetical protein
VGSFRHFAVGITLAVDLVGSLHIRRRRLGGRWVRFVAAPGGPEPIAPAGFGNRRIRARQPDSIEPRRAIDHSICEGASTSGTRASTGPPPGVSL